MPIALRRATVAAALLVALSPSAAAFDLFARHEVSVQFTTPQGQPMAGAEVQVFAPGKPGRPALTGRTDKTGKFAFPAGQDGFWTAEAHSGREIARVMIRVGGGEPKKPVSPFWLIGGLALLLVLALGYRILRLRSRRPR
jgi:hypothetical protein